MIYHCHVVNPLVLQAGFQVNIGHISHDPLEGRGVGQSKTQLVLLVRHLGLQAPWLKLLGQNLSKDQPIARKYSEILVER